MASVVTVSQYTILDFVRRGSMMHVRECILSLAFMRCLVLARSIMTDALRSYSVTWESTSLTDGALGTVFFGTACAPRTCPFDLVKDESSLVKWSCVDSNLTNADLEPDGDSNLAANLRSWRFLLRSCSCEVRRMLAEAAIERVLGVGLSRSECFRSLREFQNHEAGYTPRSDMKLR